jgi:hypothetical protein
VQSRRCLKVDADLRAASDPAREGKTGSEGKRARRSRSTTVARGREPDAFGMKSQKLLRSTFEAALSRLCSHAMIPLLDVFKAAARARESRPAAVA